MEIKTTAGDLSNFGRPLAIGWSFGPCSTSTRYDNNTAHLERCCLRPGKHILTCYNHNQPEGWKNGLILEVQNNEYCDDFMAYRARRQIMVPGKLCI